MSYVKKRIIPCLDIKDGQTVKGINFGNLKDAGDPVELAKKYANEGADELVFLDITATIENRKTLAKLVEKIAQEIDIPFTVGGGINSAEDVALLLAAGADKISLNSSAVKRKELISEIAGQFGNQCVVIAIDTTLIDGVWKVFVNGGTKETEYTAINWAKEVETLGAGEILLTSMNSDGTKNGFDLDITEAICKSVNIPVIASGGAGSEEDFKQLFQTTKATAGLAASIFHYGELPIPTLKKYLNNNKIPVRCK